MIDSNNNNNRYLTTKTFIKFTQINKKKKKSYAFKVFFDKEKKKKLTELKTFKNFFSMTVEKEKYVLVELKMMS